MIEFKNIEKSKINYDFDWYEIFTIDELNKIPVPDFLTDFTVDRQQIRVLIVISKDFSNKNRYSLTIEFRKKLISLAGFNDVVENDNISIMFYQDKIYFGIKR